MEEQFSTSQSLSTTHILSQTPSHSSTLDVPSQSPSPTAGTDAPATDAGASFPPHAPTRTRKNPSVVWEHFEKMMEADGKTVQQPARAKCKYCPQTYACDSKSGTTTMRNHLFENCRKSPLYKPVKMQRTVCFDSATNGGNVICGDYDKDVCRMFLIKMIIRDELTFSFVEGQGFIDFMRVTQPKFHVPSRRTIARGVFDLYLKEKEYLKMVLAHNQQRVSITTDTWTSIQNMNYMVITAHFIDVGWNLHKRILNFCIIDDHKGKTIGKLLESCLIQWGIEKVFTIVVDNASPNEVAVNYLRQKLGNWGQQLLSGNFLHMRCACHILNLIVRDGMEELGSSIDGIRNCVKYIRSSPARLAKFRKCAAQEKSDHKGGVVPLDVCTRWNSTYFMLDIALKYRKAFLRLEDEDSHFEAYFEETASGDKREGPPRNVDWDKAASLMKILKTFYDATLKFSGSKIVTANEPLVWMSTVLQEIDNCLNSGDDVLIGVATSMKLKFDKYWMGLDKMNPILLIAVVLDPRFKLLYLEYFFNDIEHDKVKQTHMMEQVKSIMFSLYEEYGKSDPSAKEASLATTSSSTEDVTSSSLDDSYSANMKKFMQLRKQKSVVEIRNELDKYFLEASEDPFKKDFMILNWWKEHASRFPILSKMARDVFAIPASTVASESAFSTGSRVVDPFRASLTPKMVEALVCTSDWLKSSGMMFYKEPLSDELELYNELEKLELEKKDALTGLDGDME